MGRIKNEEYATLGDFIKTSFVRDQEKIMMRFPKLNAVFLGRFSTQLAEIKVLESSLLLLERKKAVTSTMHAEVATLNKELNFLRHYMEEAGLNSDVVTALKNDLFARNVEGAVLNIEQVKQFVAAHLNALISEGMAPEYLAQLQARKQSLSEKNALQNDFVNRRKILTNSNQAQYNALYGSIAKIMKAGKLVFDGTVKKDEYTVSKLIGRMRAPKHHETAVAVS